jgi:hypothetical protein
MSNRVVPKGSVNLNSTLAPGLLIQESLISGAVTGVATNLVGAVGAAAYGPVNSPTLISDIDDCIFNFGSPQNRKYDIGTFVNAACLQGNQVGFYVIRVTDGTDITASANILDAQSSAAIGIILAAKYSGTGGNSFQARLTAGSVTGTYTLVIGRPGFASESYKNIGGTGLAFWQNLANAVNQGSGLQGPSQLAVASLPATIGTMTVTAGGSGYATPPSVGFTGGGGTGAAATAILGFGVNIISVTAGGTGYVTAPTVNITGGGGSGATATATLTGDVVTAITVDTAGSGYTSAPTITLTGGGGTGATASATLLAAGAVKGFNITNGGSGYTSVPTVSLTGGSGTGATATAAIGSTTAPALNATYTFSGGTDGYTDLVDTDFLGVDSANSTGMYALKNTNVSLFALIDCVDSATFTDQVSFAETNAAIAVATGPLGQTPSQAITALQEAGIQSTSFVYLVGDYCAYLDTYNSNIQRLISPQGFYAGLMGNLAPQNSPLNKRLNGILATQLTLQNRIYSDSQIEELMNAGIDVISKPTPGGNFFACQTGKCANPDANINNVFIQRMANFLALSLSESGVLGTYVGDLQTPDTRVSARNAISSFLQDLVGQGQIEAFSVELDDGNNPIQRVRLGFMEADVQVQLFSVIIVFLINLQVGTAAIQSVTPTT